MKKKKENLFQQKANRIKPSVSKRYYLTTNRVGNYELLNELQYEKKLIYG